MKSDYFVHSTAIISSDSSIGRNTKIWHFSHIFGCSKVGEDCTLGQNVMVGPNVSIGNRCKIQNNVSLYKGIIVEDDVFCGPSCVFTNVRTPRSFIDRKEEFSDTILQKGATVGANATIVCGIKLGKYSMIGAGSVVTKDVKNFSLVVGNPAKHIGWVSRTGDRLSAKLRCPRTGEKYIEEDGNLYEG